MFRTTGGSGGTTTTVTTLAALTSAVTGSAKKIVIISGKVWCAHRFLQATHSDEQGRSLETQSSELGPIRRSSEPKGLVCYPK